MEPQQNDIFIIGGGSSLKDFDFNLINNCTIMACNETYKLINPHYLIWMDFSFYENNRVEIDALSCEKYTSSSNYRTGNAQDIKYFMPSKFFSMQYLDGIYVGHPYNSLTGVAAISLSIVLGYKTIYLVGFDGDNFEYFHGQPISDIQDKIHYYDTFKEIDSVKIYNLNKKSLIKVFEYKDIKSVLKSKLKKG